VGKHFGPFEQIELPNGSAVYYREANHSYWEQIKQKSDSSWSGSGRIPGASTASKPLDFRPDNLLKWAARTNGEGVAILAADGLSLDEVDDMRTALGWLESAEAIWDALVESELTYEHLRDRRAKEGTNVHERMLHALARGEKVPSLAKLSEAERGYGQAVLTWWRDRQPTPLQFEQVVYSRLHGYAGRFDLRAEVEGEVVLLDLKTSGFISLAAHAQLRAYDIASEESGFGPSNRLLILQVLEDGSYHEIPCEATQGMFLNALATYRDAAELGKRCRAEAKQRQKVAA
jgi:hypothetical protein